LPRAFAGSLVAPAMTQKSPLAFWASEGPSHRPALNRFQRGRYGAGAMSATIIP
jgi:hypothetical protein